MYAKLNCNSSKCHSETSHIYDSLYRLGIDEDLSSDSDDEDIKSSCSSITDSVDITSETSSVISDSASGQTSEAELSDSQGNQSSSETEKQQSLLASEREPRTMSASTSSMPCDTNSDRHESSFERNKGQNDGIGKDMTPNSDDKAAGIEAKTDKKESKLPSSVSCVKINFQNNYLYVHYFFILF